MQREGYHRLNLSDLELFLAPDSFIRCHRSYIVNIDFIDEIQPESALQQNLAEKEVII